MVRWTLCFATTLLLAACSAKTSDAPTAVADGGISHDATQPSSSGGASSSGGPVVVAPGEPRVAYSGRTDTSDPAGPRLGWGGSQVMVRFEGTALTITIAESEISDGGSRYDVNVDGQSQDKPLALETEGTKAYDIVKDLAPGTHVVRLTRRTEAQVGISQFLKFEFPNGGKLLAPLEEPTRHIEFVGDSEMTGYGIECTSTTEAFSSATENELKTYPELVAKSLDAEMHNLGYSGKGVYRNGFPGGDRYGTYYPEAVPRAQAVAWDFSWQPDAIWVALGANDYDNGGDPNRPPPTAQHVHDAFKALVDTIRAKNPTAKIVLVVQAFVNDDYPPGYNARTNLRTILTQLVGEYTAAGDKSMFFAELPAAGDADLTGCDSHPNAGLHQKLAPIVAAKISEVTGWK